MNNDLNIFFNLLHMFLDFYMASNESFKYMKAFISFDCH